LHNVLPPSAARQRFGWVMAGRPPSTPWGPHKMDAGSQARA
jgi:hypothetical protein